jgi:hypothetical protein
MLKALTFKFDWERAYLATSDERVFRTRSRISGILTSCANNGTRFEIEVTTSGICTRRRIFDRGIVKPPLFIQSVFGILGGIGAHPDDVAHMKRTADRLFGDEYRWSVLGAGRNQLPVAAMSAAMGGNVRVGLEDSLWLGPGKLAESNAAQVKAACAMIEAIGLSVATPDERAGDPEAQGPDGGRVLNQGPKTTSAAHRKKTRPGVCREPRCRRKKKSAHQAATLIAASAAAAPGAAARKLATSSASFAFAVFRWRSLTWP